MRHVRGRGENDGSRLYLVVTAVLAVADDDRILLVDDLLHLRTQLNALAQRRGEGFGEGGGSADDAAAQTLSESEHQTEVSDACTG